MKKTGFTLIELLAVIVILAIIALIATPTILGVIEKARKGASEQSALGYIDAVEKQVAINQVKNENLINDGTYNVPMTGITVKGEAPTKGWLKIEKGLVTNYSFVIGKYVITKGSETVKGDTASEKPNGSTTKSGPTMTAAGETDTYKAIVYLDPTDLTKYCDASNSISTTGTKEGCMKWYAYSDDGTNYTMILDHNTTATVSSWSESKTQITTDITSWDSSLKARLITAEEVVKITGNTNWTSTSEWYCLDTNQQDSTNYCSKTQGTSKYAWLFDYTIGCKNYGCNVEDTIYSDNKGYWTNSLKDSTYARSVHRTGTLDYNEAARYSYYGIRPVITISKSILN